MREYDPFSLQPTFPLDQDEIATRTTYLKIASPITIGASVATILISILTWADSPVFGVAALVAGGAFLYSHWNKRHPKFEARVMEDMIRESNLDQDAKLARLVHRMRSTGNGAYATALGRFLLLKKRIDVLLADDKVPTPNRAEIDNLVDSICSAVIGELNAAIEADSKLGDVLTSGDGEELLKLEAERTGLLGRVMQAYGTLYETFTELDSLAKAHRADPFAEKELDAEGHTTLDNMIDQLRDEAQVARRIKDRLSEESEVVNKAVEEAGRMLSD